MTIAISLKVHDGVVLAADSASTLLQKDEAGNVGVVNVYNNANKVVNLYKGLPLGVLTWGAGSIGPISITTVLKDLRSMLGGHVPGPNGADWSVNPENYTVLEVAERVREYTFETLYAAAYKDWPEPPALGLLVAGYSSGSSHAEEYEIQMQGVGSPPPRLLRQATECGFTVGGQPEPISRLVFGVDPMLPSVLQNELGVDPSQALPAAEVIKNALQYPLVQDAMPLQDALDLAEFLVDLTIKTMRFRPGPDTVGGPIELAAITKHEGFKWVHRKHYYDASINKAGGQ